MNLRRLSVVFAAIYSLFVSGVAPVNAIYNGSSALGSNYVLNIRIGNSYCSAAPIDKYLVLTAAHCLVSRGVVVEPSSVRVYAPGVDTNQSSTFARGVHIVYPTNFYNNDRFTEPNDIAFIVIDSSFAISTFPKLATYEKAREIVNSNTPIKVFGYGITQAGGRPVSVPNVFTATPITQRRYSSFVGYERTYLSFAADQRGSTCPGDSGGPSIAEFQGITYLVSVHSGAGGPCSTSFTGSMTATVSGEYPQLLAKAYEFMSSQKPNVVSDLALTNTGESGTISWKFRDEELSTINGFSVLDENSSEMCRTGNDKKSCAVFVKPGKNTFKVIALGKFLNSEPTVSTFNVSLTPPINPKITRVGLSGTVTWDTPLAFTRYVDYYTVQNSQGAQLCKTSLSSCAFGLAIGTNKFSVFAHYKEIRSLPMEFTVPIKNAQPPGLQSIKAFKSSLEVEWAQVADLGDANPTQIKIILQDSKNGDELCSVTYPQKSCLIALTARDYQFSVLLRTDLGNTIPGAIYPFSGAQQLRINDSLTQRIDTARNNLLAASRGNSKYSQVVEPLISLAPIIDENTPIDNALVENINNYEGRSIALIKSFVLTASDRANSLTSQINSLLESTSKHISSAESIIKEFEQSQYVKFTQDFADLEARNRARSLELNSLINEPEIECRNLVFSSTISSQYADLEDACGDLQDSLNLAADVHKELQDSFAQLKSLNEEVKALKVKVDEALKAKREAEAKAKADAAKKRTTITCVKGNITKKVTALNPKCPAGYKKK